MLRLIITEDKQGLVWVKSGGGYVYHYKKGGEVYESLDFRKYMHVPVFAEQR